MKHRLLFFVGVVCAIGVEVLAKGPWSHAVWAPTLIMFLTKAEEVVALKPPAGEVTPVVKA